MALTSKIATPADQLRQLADLMDRVDKLERQLSYSLQQGRDLGNITGKSSIVLDQMYANVEDGLVAIGVERIVGLPGLNTVNLIRQSGKWHKSAAYTLIP